MFTLDDRVTARLQADDYHDWRARVEAIGGCARPIRLTGGYSLIDATTGSVIHDHDGDVMVPCNNRRESVCSACSDRYAADAFHLVRAGLVGGSKGVPETVTAHPRAFVTLTAPSFGAVHNRAATASGKVRRCICGTSHHEHDTRLGTPIDSRVYDYEGAVLWQAHTGLLWARFTQAVTRTLAGLVGIPQRVFKNHARLSYGKVAEYQRRGLVHFHAVVRVDGPDGPNTPPPAWATPELLDQAVTTAAASVAVTPTLPDSDQPRTRTDGRPLLLRWGSQVDVRTIDGPEDDTEGDGIKDQALAGYIAKYATKGTGTSAAADRPIRSQLAIDHLQVSDHHRRMIQTAWDLGGLAEYEDLNLRRWAHMLGFRGHFLTKSRAYSTTFKTIRGDRRAFRLAESLLAAELDPETTLLVNDWQFTGSGYRDDAEQELAAAISTRVRDQRARKHRKEYDDEQALGA